MRIFLLTLLMLCCTMVAQAKDKTYGDFNNVEYIRNYDGDTVTVNIPDVHPLLGKKISVRVYGIDTPEIRGACLLEKSLAYEAKLVVTDALLNAERVHLLNVRRGKYFRIVADVETEKASIAKLLLDKGLAVEYNGGTKVKDWCLIEPTNKKDVDKK